MASLLSQSISQHALEARQRLKLQCFSKVQKAAAMSIHIDFTLLHCAIAVDDVIPLEFSPSILGALCAQPFIFVRSVAS